MCQSTGGVCTRQVTLYRFPYVIVKGSVHETSNFIQGYMCHSTVGLCRRKVNLYRATCARVLGSCVRDK